MTTPTLADLLTSPSEEDTTDLLLALLAIAGFPVTQWQSGGIARTLVKMTARATSNLVALVTTVAGAGFNKYSTGGWLTLLADQVYGNERNGASFTIATVTVSLDPGADPTTITAGQLWFLWPATQKRYRNIDAVPIVLSLGSTNVPITVQAEFPGSDHNAPDGGISELSTPLPGLDITGSTVTTQGTDDELDTALQLRNSGKWGTTGAAANATGYASWAATASAEVTRVVAVENAPDEGDVTVIIAGPSGPATPTAIAAVKTYITNDTSTDPPTVRSPLCVDVTVQSATLRLIPITGTITIPAIAGVTQAAALALVTASVNAYINSLPIARAGGGETTPGGVTAIGSQVEAAALAPLPKTASYPSPNADVDLAFGEVAVADLSALTITVN